MGCTKQLGCHPLVAVRSETGEIVHSRLRGGSSQKGAAHFGVETVNLVRPGWRYELVEDLDRLGVE